MVNKQLFGKLFLLLLVMRNSLSLSSQSSWFIDGYHGGIWGHYPARYTSFIVEQLQRHPDWRINLEIEPVTWDLVKVNDPGAYKVLQALMSDQTVNGRIEYVNPAYGQSYLYNISGESIIRQMTYGIQKLRQHFPGIAFSTYSSEEPCFTSALPQVLRSFGFRYASLKNPNTCWGGYVRAHGGELINWIGPDGSSLLTVPRYASEALEQRSTWQTTAWANSPVYVNTALQQGIVHPVGMCLQDAGWRNGPWLEKNNKLSTPAQYTTWRNYFENIADRKLTTDWKFSQEDVQVSLVWGAQVLQRIAQQVRQAEDKLIATEKIVAMAAVYKGFSWPQQQLDKAWQNLLLAQHHDCWIVPYNGSRGNTWADKVRNWTGETISICDSIAVAARLVLSGGQSAGVSQVIKVFNTTGIDREGLVSVPWDKNSEFRSDQLSVQQGKQFFPVQWVTDDSTGQQQLLFRAATPSMGYSTYRLSNKPVAVKGASIQQQKGLYVLETDLYRLVIDPAAGGTIRSLVSKQLQNREWINSRDAYRFNELNGNFFTAGGRQSTSEQAAVVRVLENGPLRIKVQMGSSIAGHPVQQLITLVQGEPRIDMQVRIDWQQPVLVGNDYKQDSYKAEDYRKAFYDDHDKLLLLFPVKLAGAKVCKNAPFDVTESKLDNTFFTTWDSIKNNVVLHWVDIMDQQGKYGMALFTDHTTAYVQGEGHPLGLVVQYAGRGLWGRNYAVNGPTIINYSLLPHAGVWDKAGIEAERAWLADPLQGQFVPADDALADKSLLNLDKKGWEVSAMTIAGNDLLVRLYNAAGNDSTVHVSLQAGTIAATIEELNGTTKLNLIAKKANDGATMITINAPRFGIRTIRFRNVVK
jgi:alpha-mannosidase